MCPRVWPPPTSAVPGRVVASPATLLTLSATPTPVPAPGPLFLGSGPLLPLLTTCLRQHRRQCGLPEDWGRITFVRLELLGAWHPANTPRSTEGAFPTRKKSAARRIWELAWHSRLDLRILLLDIDNFLNTTVVQGHSGAMMSQSINKTAP